MQKLEIDASAWAELNHLLDAALDQPASHREQWIERLAPQYAGLKPRLRDLLSRAGQTKDRDFLDTLPKFDRDADADDVVDAAASGERPGDAVGPYRLVRELGSGGMGAVWLAERLDGLINRPVALKLPHGAWKRAGLAERMTRERDILATLTHPNIARLYDAGLTAQGQPFLAIEYVEGHQIDQYCREQQCDLISRLKLFAQVADAVAYAHAKLVVHRDLKPANMLVTSDGQVRLLDFGIAKLLEEGQAKETRLTELSGRALTPEYASPEQILGEPLTITSDVYSLGVVLYELLCGRRPYKLKRDSRGALEEAIVQADPAPPSEVAEHQWRKSLGGDLDTIVLKALKKAPEARYVTVHALLDDIERYLSARPVLAQPDSLRYRARKFMARNALAVAAAAATITALVVGVSVVAWQARVALAEKTRAEEVTAFIASVFREADPTQGGGKVLSAAELLRQAERRLHDRGSADPAMRLELLAILGESLFGLQENADAARVTEQALRLQVSAAVPNDLLNARLHLILSQAYEYLGRNDDALVELARTFQMLTASGQTATPLFVHAKLHEAAMGQALANYVVAERAAREAVSAATDIIGPRSSEAATGLQLLSQAYTFAEQRQLAVDTARQAYEIMLDLHNRDLSHPKVMDSAMYYGRALQFVGDFDAAYEQIRNAATGSATLFGGESRMVGELLAACVPLEIERGDLRVAVANARRSIAIYLEQQEPGTADHAARVRLLGHALLASRVPGEAAERLEEALRLAVAAKSTASTLHARAHLGLALVYLGRFDEAESYLRQTIDQAGGLHMRAQHLAMRNLGTSLRLQGRFRDSLAWFDKALVAAAIHHNHRGDLAQGLLEAGLARLELGELDAAQQAFTRAETLFSDVQKQRMTPARADLLVGMARVQLQRREYATALQALQAADLFWRDFNPDNRWAGAAALWLGRCYLAMGRTREAVEALHRAERALSQSPVPSDVALLQLARGR
jgi:tetratricopeptide (TPR) repeat protein